MKNVYDITNEFERRLGEYTGAPYVVTVDNQSNALFLSLYYENHIKKSIKTDTITIPSRTYPSVPCEIIHAGLKVAFKPVEGKTIKGAYNLEGSNVWDSALSFTSEMYKPNTHMCISFTGSRKIFKLLSKGGAILTDDYDAYKWFKKARFSGRDEVDYHKDNFDKDSVIGWNFYLNPELSLRGLVLMTNFYNLDGSPKIFDDIELPYPDLSKFSIYSSHTPTYTKDQILNKCEDNLIRQWIECNLE